MTSRPSSWLYDERRLREVGGVEDDPLRLAKPTLEGEEPERESGGVCTDIMAEWESTAAMELMGQKHSLKNTSLCYTIHIFTLIYPDSKTPETKN